MRRCVSVCSCVRVCVLSLKATTAAEHFCDRRQQQGASQTGGKVAQKEKGIKDALLNDETQLV